MAESVITDNDIKRIARGIREDASIFAKAPIGGAGDNSDIVTAIKESDNKKRTLAKAEAKLLNDLKKELNLEKGFKDIADVLKQEDQAKKYAVFANKMAEVSKVKFENEKELKAALEELENAAISAGTTLKKEGVEMFKPLTNASQKQTYIIRDGIKKSEEKIKTSQKNIKSIKETILKRAELSRSYDIAKQKLGDFGKVVAQITKKMLSRGEDELRFAQATATADAGWISGLKEMGVSQLNYMQILKDTRQESLAATSVGVDFKASLSDSAASLRNLTYSNEEAAKGAAMFNKNMARIGVSQDGLGDAVAEQTKIYKDNYRALNYTVEEFGQLTQELISSQGMRSTLLGLQEDERKAYLLSVQQRQAEYLAMGYTIERAKELQNTFQALNKQNPKERMKQAAKTRAMMGAMGMGGEGAKLFDLQTRYRTMGPTEKAAAEKEMAEIQSKASKKFGQMSGSGAGIGQAMVLQTMADKSGFTQIADTFETESGQGIKFNKAQLNETQEINSWLSKILEGVSYYQQADKSAVSGVATDILGGLGSAIGTTLTTLAGTWTLGKMFGGKGTLGKIIGGTGNMAGAAMSGLGTAAVSGVKGAGSAAAGAMMGGRAAVGLSKAAGKTALKAIPGIGLIVSLGLMGSRLADGDLMGAGMELVSGAAGLIPGVGTAASIGMSGAIVARDLSKGAQQPPEEITTVEQEQTAQAKSQKDVLVELSITMKALNEYLLAGTEASGDQVKAIDKQTTTLKENLRFNAVPDARAPS